MGGTAGPLLASWTRTGMGLLSAGVSVRPQPACAGECPVQACVAEIGRCQIRVEGTGNGLIPAEKRAANLLGVRTRRQTDFEFMKESRNIELRVAKSEVIEIQKI